MALHKSLLLLLLFMMFFSIGCFDLSTSDSEKSPDNSDKSSPEPGHPSSHISIEDVQMSASKGELVSQSIGVEKESLGGVVGLSDSGEGLFLVDSNSRNFNQNVFSSELWALPFDVDSMDFGDWLQVSGDSAIGSYSIDFNGDGEAVLAWVGSDVLWYSIYSPESGIGAPRYIDTVSQLSDVSASINSQGDALISWINDPSVSDRSVFSAFYSSSSDEVGEFHELTREIREGQSDIVLHAGNGSNIPPSMNNNASFSMDLFPTPDVQIELLDDGTAFMSTVAMEGSNPQIVTRYFEDGEWGRIGRIGLFEGRNVRSFYDKESDRLLLVASSWSNSLFYGEGSFGDRLIEMESVHQFTSQESDGQIIQSISVMPSDDGSAIIDFHLGDFGLARKHHYQAVRNGPSDWEVERSAFKFATHMTPETVASAGILTAPDLGCGFSPEKTDIVLLHSSGQRRNVCLDGPATMARIGVNRFGRGAVFGANGFHGREDDGFDAPDQTRGYFIRLRNE